MSKKLLASSPRATLKRQDSAGFSMIEVILAFTVFTVAFFALLPTFPMGLKINKLAENDSSAIFLSQQKIEELVRLPYGEVATGTIEARHVVSTDPSDSYYLFERETIVNTLDANLISTSTDIGLKKIMVNIYYRNALSKEAAQKSTQALISRRQ